VYLKEGKIVEIKKLTQILLGLGGLVTVGSVIWWASFYGQVTKEVGGNLGDFFQCLYTSGGPCGFVVGIAPPYNPTLFWIGAIMLGVGIILQFSLKKDGTP
jgi:hypothetical protein